MYLALKRGHNADVTPMTDAANIWQFVFAVCSFGVASSSWRLLQLLQHVAYHVLMIVYLQQFMCNDVVTMTIFYNGYNHHILEVSWESLWNFKNNSRFQWVKATFSSVEKLKSITAI